MVRKLINNLHLWLGIASGLILFVVCLTGTIYTFRTEIEEWLEPEKYRIQAIEESRLPISVLVENAESATGGKAARISFTDDQARPFTINIKADKEDFRGTNYMVNQYSGEVLGSVKGPASGFFLTVFKLHRWLLMDIETGRPIVGAATLIFLFLCISGFILWLPKKIKGWNSFKPGFKIKTDANWKRINHDLHSTLGFYALFFLIVMSLTGLTWSFKWYDNAFHKVLTGKERLPRGGKAQKAETAAVLSYEEALSIVNRELNYVGKTIITVPTTGEYEVTKFDKKKFNKEAADKVTVSSQSGEVLKTALFSDLTTGEQITRLIHGLHMGTTYGMFSKVLYFISCLIATSMPITGVFIWWNKLRKTSRIKRTVQRKKTMVPA